MTSPDEVNSPPKGGHDIDDTKYWASFLLPFFVLVFNFFRLAESPQSPDGAEMVMAAIQGGVLHSPGFPLQAWIDRLFVQFPTANTAYNLSLLSLFSFCIASFVFLKCLKALEVSFLPALGAFLCFIFFPASWPMALQPEKYSLLILVLMTLAYFSIMEIKQGKSRAPLIGLLLGLGFAQHIAAVLFIPFLLAAAWASGGHLIPRARYLFVSMGIAFLISSLFYVSLFQMTSPDAWPDWGKIQNLHDLFRLVTRQDFHFFYGFDINRTGWITGLGLLKNDLFKTLLLPFLIIGLCQIPINFRNLQYLSLGITFIFTLVALFFTQLPGNSPLDTVYLGRFENLALIPICLIAGLGFEFSWKFLMVNMIEFSLIKYHKFIFLVLGSGIVLFALGQSESDFSEDRTLEIYREALGAQLPEKAFYMATSDLEPFYGVPNRRVLNHSEEPGKSGIRFPQTGDFDWYIERMTLRNEPRIASLELGQKTPGLYNVLQKAFEKGFEIYSTSPELLVASGHPVAKVGLFYVITSLPTEKLKHKILEACINICGVLSKNHRPFPQNGHGYSRFLLKEFKSAFAGAAKFLSRPENLLSGFPEKILTTKTSTEKIPTALKKISNALEKGEDPQAWIQGCQSLY